MERAGGTPHAQGRPQRPARARLTLGPDPDVFSRPVVDLARRLIGARLCVDAVGGIIVETEAYARDDAASHSFGGPTARNAAMFGPVGRAYVYRIYGAHWCLNIVGGPEPGAAVLIRALEPTDGLEIMAARRGVADPRRLCAGPGRLCQALGVTRAHDGLPLAEPPFMLDFAPAAAEVMQDARIGIRKAADAPWRFTLRGSRYLSRSVRPL